MLERRLKLVHLINVPVATSLWCLSMPGTFKLVTEIGQFFLGTMQYVFSAAKVVDLFKVRCFNVSKTWFSLRYQLWRLSNVLSWSVSLKYQLVCCYNASNRSILFTYQGVVAKTSQIGPSHWRNSCDVMMISQHGPRCPDLCDT